MKLTFEQKTEDIMDLSRNSLKQNKLLKFYGVIILAVILINGFVFFSRGDLQLDSILSWIVPIVIIIIIWYFAIKIFLRKRLENEGNKQMLTGKRKIDLNDKQIKVWTPQAETIYQWSAISKVSESEKNYFLYLGRAQAIIVSKSAFNGQVEEQSFLDLLRGKELWK